MEESFRSGVVSLDDGSDSDDTAEDIELQEMLAKRILKQVDPDDLVNIPVNRLHLDWDKIKIGGLNKQQLKKIWNGILRKERLYMNTYSVIGSFLDNPRKKQVMRVQHYNELIMNQSSKLSSQEDVKIDISQISEVINKSQKDPKKKSVSQSSEDIFHKNKKDLTKEEKKELKERLDKYPSKPLNGYQIFCKKICSEQGVSITECSPYWKKLDDAEKAKYNEQAKVAQQEYVANLEAFVEENPSDEYAKELCEKASKQYSKSSKKPDRAGKDASKRKLENGPGPSSSSLDETDFSSPSPKKHKKEKRATTGFDIYKERKQEEFEVENPGLDNQDIEKKLLKKYNKLSDTKKEKYEKLAEERNEEG